MTFIDDVTKEIAASLLRTTPCTLKLYQAVSCDVDV